MLHPECGWQEQLRRIRRRALIGGGLLTLAAIPVVVFALVGLPHVIRGPLVRNVITEDLDVARFGPENADFARTFALLTGSELAAGNQAEILANGDETFPRLWTDLRAARRSITVQMYYIVPSTVADTMVAILAERARAGVDVYFLYDAFGAKELPERLRDTLRLAGVRAAEFRPMRWYALDRANHRSHVRGIVMDGRIAYTGGFGLDDKWLGAGRRSAEWRETNVRFAGPSAVSLQALFVAKWSETVGELLTSDRLLPDSDMTTRASPAVAEAALVSSPPLGGSTTAERLLALSIAGARRRLYISNAYFVPQSDFVALLVGAARRGVDVRILTNGPESDIGSTRLAGHRQYPDLLRAGVRIWEYRPTTIHAKTLVVDDILSSVGTTNFDNRSLAYNNEVAFVARDRRLARVLDSLFLDDLRFADEVRLPAFERRGWVMRVRERAAGLIGRIL